MSEEKDVILTAIAVGIQGVLLRSFISPWIPAPKGVNDGKKASGRLAVAPLWREPARLERI